MEPSKNKLRRTLGLPSLLSVGVGVVVAQVCFVSVLQGIGIGGGDFLIALLIAFFLTICYVLTFSELSLMMPRAGSISTYTEVAIGHFPAIIATIAGYLAPAIFAGPAELFLVEYILDFLYPGFTPHIGLILLIIVVVLNILGIEIFASLQNVLAFTMLAALLIVGVTGLMTSTTDGGTIASLFDDVQNLNAGVLSLTVLAIWAFVGLEFVCPLVEETKKPEKNIPRSMILAAVVLLVIYGLVSLAGYRNVPASALTSSDVPHWLLVDALFGKTGRLIMAVLAITATCSTLNTIIATVPRMLFGMAHNHQLPGIFKKVHSKYQTPWFSILFVSTCIFIPLIVYRGSSDAIIIMVISAATIWLIAYIIAHIDLIVLRIKHPEFHRPFRSPFFPIPQIVGILGMGFLLINNSPSPEMTWKVYTNAGILLSITSIFAILWIKIKMKKKLFDPEPLEKALSD